MNRAETRLYNMPGKVLVSAKWGKMLQKVEFGKEMNPYKPVPITLNGRLKNTWATAWDDKMEFSKDYYKRATPKSLMNTMRHEMVHTLLSQNDIHDHHSSLFKTCCHVLGLNRPDHKEGAWNYKHVCSKCGWWQKSMKRRDKIAHVCGGNGGDFRFLVTKTEYQKLARISKVGSKLMPVNINAYQIMVVEKIKPNLRLKEDK